jgi:hypothetical protein
VVGKKVEVNIEGKSTFSIDTDIDIIDFSKKKIDSETKKLPVASRSRNGTQLSKILTWCLISPGKQIYLWLLHA